MAAKACHERSACLFAKDIEQGASKLNFNIRKVLAKYRALKGNPIALRRVQSKAQRKKRGFDSLTPTKGLNDIHVLDLFVGLTGVNRFWISPRLHLSQKKTNIHAHLVNMIQRVSPWSLMAQRRQRRSGRASRRCWMALTWRGTMVKRMQRDMETAQAWAVRGEAPQVRGSVRSRRGCRRRHLRRRRCRRPRGRSRSSWLLRCPWWSPRGLRRRRCSRTVVSSGATITCAGCVTLVRVA